MSNVTLSVVVPSIDIVFDDDTAAILTAVDADTVLGVTPGSVGLLVLAATTGDGVLATIGGASPTTAASLAQQAVVAHASQRNPHREYATQAQLDQIALGNASAVAAHAMSTSAHRQYSTQDQMQMADSSTAGRVMAHAVSRSAHPDRPTFDQAILQSQFFGG